MHRQLGRREVASPLVCFCRRLDDSIPPDEKLLHVALEKKAVGHAPENTEWRVIVEHVPYQGDASILREEMIVIESTKSAAHERISEVRWRLESSNAAG